MEWTPCISEELGLGFLMPPGWQVVDGGPEGSVMAIAPRPPGDAFQSNFSVMIRALETLPTLAEFNEYQLRNFEVILTEFQLLDLEDCQVAGAPATRMLATHRQGIFSLTLEQWWALGDGGYVVLSGTAETLQYPGTADDFAGMVASFGSAPDA